jgi:hypothetical protein
MIRYIRNASFKLHILAALPSSKTLQDKDAQNPGAGPARPINALWRQVRCFLILSVDVAWYNPSGS